MVSRASEFLAEWYKSKKVARSSSRNRLEMPSLPNPELLVLYLLNNKLFYCGKMPQILKSKLERMSVKE
jgi:hypothetical protein